MKRLGNGFDIGVVDDVIFFSVRFGPRAVRNDDEVLGGIDEDRLTEYPDGLVSALAAQLLRYCRTLAMQMF